MTDTMLIQLNGGKVGLALEQARSTAPVWRHFGAPLGEHALVWPADGMRPPPPTVLDGDPPFTVLPTHGFGWFHQPALLGSRPGSQGDSDWAQDFRLDGMSRDGDALLMRLSDPIASLAVTLSYSIDPGSDVVRAWAEVENLGETPYRLDWLAAACVPLPAQADQVLGFSGRWTLEFQEARETLGVATWRRDNRRGRTSHDSFPGVIVGASLGDDEGAVFGAHLGWSGNHTILIEPLTDGRRQLQLGEWLAPGEVVLARGERYRTPCAFLSFSDQGLNGLSAQFHRFVRTRVLDWPQRHMRPRPVILNTWEAVYCEHDLDDLQALAGAAARIGVERFVLDDGWFHRRGNDRAGLGDWWPDARKYPQGLTPLVEHVRELGMEFGLWIEPEMVNPDSDLFRTHPEWVLQLAGRPFVTGRNQLVLDLAETAVTDYLFESIGALLRDHSIAYLKWDMNRDLATAGHHGRAAYRRQTLALYRLLERLRRAFPDVEIESCASGGGRADYGALAYMHRVWTSDCNDALTRIDIQRGFLRFFPPEVMGAHIGAACSHTTGRRHSMPFRAAVALLGHLGLELDVRTLSDAEADELRYWITLYKQCRPISHRGVLHQGRFGDALVWTQATAEDGRASLLSVFRRREDTARYAMPVPAKGLRRDLSYVVRILHMPHAPHFKGQTEWLAAMREGGVEMPGATLMDLGVPIPPMPPESAVIVCMKAVAEDS
ncbi:alpha-galactosidase [Trinickia dinghuensis]|uniref:Alpha-galactosidase n=1 Tax=Trinickia dinghuensis TaxID=2291023 RepID=A0A3D8JXG3_9BURK|nr:alpha-galactosidase [Trinickia dinghuensis]RDU97502.1 alpha-galactosidase [Trinickia dinghuensis]